MKNFTYHPLFLAPMEGIGDRAFRKTLASIGGFDWACTEFIRVPSNAYIPSLVRNYCPDDTKPILQAAQIMGAHPDLVAQTAAALEKKGAPRVDLNCGCPSNTVTGRGAGSCLLKTPEKLYEIAKAMVQAVKIPVTAKLRAGFADTSLFKENLLAAQESGISFLTLHARTKVDGYAPKARWELIAEAKSILKIPLIGNGDIFSAKDAMKMLEMTRCDGLMVGRGAAMNPWIFQEIQAAYKNEQFERPKGAYLNYLKSFISYLPQETSVKVRIIKLKQLMSYLIRSNEFLSSMKKEILSRSYESEEDFFSWISIYFDQVEQSPSG